MTTITEFKKMLREEILEPLDHPRVTGLSAEGLASYNEGFQSACALILQENTTFTDSEWVDWKIETCKSCLVGYSESGHGWMAGRRDAYTWALGELEGLQEGSEVLDDVVTFTDEQLDLIGEVVYAEFLGIAPSSEDYDAEGDAENLADAVVKYLKES